MALLSTQSGHSTKLPLLGNNGSFVMRTLALGNDNIKQEIAETCGAKERNRSGEGASQRTGAIAKCCQPCHTQQAAFFRPNALPRRVTRNS